jgi:peroxiredoxin
LPRDCGRCRPRSTFLVDEQGRIERAWHNVKADGHATQVLEALSPKI